MTQTTAQQAPLAASPYAPRVGRIADFKKFTDREAYFRLVFDDAQGIQYSAGQFVEVSVFGVGEAPISICSAPGKRDDLEMCVRSAGDVTNWLHKAEVGDPIGLRGPFGNGFDMNKVAGMDLLFVAGGLGLAPCR